MEVGTNLNTIMKPIGDDHAADFQDISIDDETADNVYYERTPPRTDFLESPGENLKCLCQCGNYSSVPNKFDNIDRTYWFGFWSPENASAKGKGKSKVFSVNDLKFHDYQYFTGPNHSNFNDPGFCMGGIVLKCEYVQPEDVGTNPSLPEDATGACENTTEWCRKSHVDNRYLDRKVSCEIGVHTVKPTHARFASNYNGFVYIERQFFDQFIDKLSSANSGLTVDSTKKWKFYTEAYNILRDNLYVLKPKCPDPEIPFYPPIDPCLISQTCDPTEAEKCDRITQWIERQTYEHYITTNFEYCAKIVLETCSPKTKIQKMRWVCIVDGLDVNGDAKNFIGEKYEGGTYTSGGTKYNSHVLHTIEAVDSFNIHQAIDQANQVLQNNFEGTTSTVSYSLGSNGEALGVQYGVKQNDKEIENKLS